MMRKLIFFLPMLLSIGLASALTINPQNDVYCSLDYCSLTVDLSKYLTTGNVNTLKGYNISNYLVKNGLDLKYSWANSNITFYANIKPASSNYWTLKTALINIDPWFNSSGWAISENQSYNFTYIPTNGADGTTYYRGFEFIPNGSIRVLEYRLSSAIGIVNCSIIRNSTKVIVDVSNPVGNRAYFTGTWLNSSEYYYMMCDGDKFDWNTTVSNIAATTTHYNVTKCIEKNTINGYGNCPYIENVNALFITQQNATYSNDVYYDIELWIDNAKANITTSCSWEPHNYTALTNLTGLPISILYNNTIFGTNITRYEGSHGLIAGYWNITANASNASTSAMTWLIHNITLGDPSYNVSLTFNTTPTGNNTTCSGTPIFINCSSYALEDGVALSNNTSNVGNQYNYTALENTTFICSWNASDCYNAGSINRTIQVIDCSIPTIVGNVSYSYIIDLNDAPMDCLNASHAWRYTLANGVSFNETYKCPYGCDSMTKTCVPDPFTQNIYFIALLLVLVGIPIGIYKFG